MEDALHSSGFIVLQIQNDLRLGNIQDAFAKSAPVKVADILRSCNSCAAIATDDFEDFLDPFSGQRLCVIRVTGIVVSDQLPRLINEDGFLLGAILLCLIPYIVQSNEHAHREQLACKLSTV